MSSLSDCYKLFDLGLEEDKSGNKEAAVKYYLEAVEKSLSLKNEYQDESTKEKLKNVAKHALDRAEFLKGIHLKKNDRPSPVMSVTSNPTVPVRTCPKPSTSRPPMHRGSSAHLKVSGGTGTYSEEEKLVLAHTSQINQNLFLPFIKEDINENFLFTIPFSDKDGRLKLAPKQRRDMSGWARISELHPEPKLIANHQVNYLTIKQTVISDCSFVASLTVTAYYEQKFQKKLITHIIYPRNSNDEPRFNPDGKYMIKLHINGIPRKVIIDDELPVGHGNRLLCSYSSNNEEFWVSLLEKAYMKVMGGYDFPGSNSNIDLHALTGWIPERVAIRPGEPDFNVDALFEKLLIGLEQGRMLVTIATGELSKEDEDRTGLVPTHAYAVLDVVYVKGLKLLKLKNPWSHLRWNGNFSEKDDRNWTPELQELLHYNPELAAKHDNGIFWIDLKSICNFFDVFYLNWNPKLFAYTYCIHQDWKGGVGPMKDAYTIGENPQFSLNISQGQGEVWVLLTRHITHIDDFRENREYITLLVYDNNGKKVYYPHSPPPFIDGVRINSPHYLCKIRMDPSRNRHYTLVVSQYEKTTTIYYTLRAYSASPFTLAKINPFPFNKEVIGEWKGITAGGCGNHPSTYMYNPKYRLEITRCLSHHLLLELRGPASYQIGLEIINISLEDSSETAPFKSTSSGAYRSGFVVLDLEDLPSGVYEVMPSTYLPGQESAFFLNVRCTSSVAITQKQ